jgi:Domain of unknown function (DUF4352)
MSMVLTRPRSAPALTCRTPVLAVGTPTAGMRQAVEDGPLRFHAIDAFCLYDACCHGGDYVRARGQFIFVALNVANVSNRPQTFVADYQRLVDGSGRIYQPDITTMSLTSAGNTRRVLDISPRVSAASLLVFDVPSGTKETDYRLRLHSSSAPSMASVVNLARGGR